MKTIFARFLLFVSPLTFVSSTLFLLFKIEPFRTHYFLFAWGSFIGFVDAWLFLEGGESLFVDRPIRFFTFLVPFSAFLWFLFEAYNLRLANWYYVNVPAEIWIRWPLTIAAFGTVVPAILIVSNLLDYWGICRRNEFSFFFDSELPGWFVGISVSLGVAMLILPLAWPQIFFPLIWGGFFFLLDPINSVWRKRSLFQEWRQKNWNRTLQILWAGLVCGFLWELWNFKAGAKWVYAFPMPDRFFTDAKIFEMPLLGFLGFPPFALEVFVMTEFVQGLQERISPRIWRLFSFLALVFCLVTLYGMEIYTFR
ncbi:MAG: hypothetical protein HYY63_06425 [Elusimicrobia bacterium]|nr:hypothetical protein [Elusimicrobiota bacterium]MBI4217541.1 hypothetical protein [Elusimicrobiota bacterium]